MYTQQTLFVDTVVSIEHHIDMASLEGLSFEAS